MQHPCQNSKGKAPLPSALFLPCLATPPAHSIGDSPPPLPITKGPVVWDWELEHADRAREKRADAARTKHHGSRAGAGVEHQVFEVDRKVLRDIVAEKMGEAVGRVVFVGSGTFNKAYLVTLVSGREVIMRVARRFMPRLKTASEVATMHYLRTRSSVPVPDVYAYEADPSNPLRAEYILMSKAPGIPLASVYHTLSYQQLGKLMTNAVDLLIPLFGHRFDKIGSLYLEGASGVAQSPIPTPMSDATPLACSSVATPGPFTSTTPKMLGTASARPLSAALSRLAADNVFMHHAEPSVTIGPIISWPFFGSNRGELTKSEEIDRGPYTSTYDYLLACAFREIRGVIRENEGRAAPHRLSLDPDEIRSSRHHHLNAVPGDESDASTEWDLSESERAWDEPGDTMYQDYRRTQRTTFLVSHLAQREQAVGEEMERFITVMEKLGVKAPGADDGGGGEKEDFVLDCHDLNLENVFVDQADPSKIVCIIDWECTTTRPLWAATHVPAFAQSSPFTARMYRQAVARLASDSSASVRDTALASQWLANETSGARLRAAHRCVEWDGWEEGLVEGILGPVEDEGCWEQPPLFEGDLFSPPVAHLDHGLGDLALNSAGADATLWAESGLATGDASPGLSRTASGSDSEPSEPLTGTLLRPEGPKALVRPDERAKERELDSTGDLCGGRGGELGRRLEAWLFDVRGEEVGAEGEVTVASQWEP